MRERIGLVGCGGRLRHVVRLLKQQAPYLEWVGLSDPDPAAVAAMRRDLSEEVAAFPSVTEMVRETGARWVLVGSPNALHSEHVVAAFEAGCSVFCEKPLALTMGDARAMETAWKASGRVFAFGFVLRYAPLYRKVHEWVSSGAIGRLVSMELNETLEFNHGGYIHGNWRRWRKMSGSHLLEKCCHDIDLALWMAGCPVRRVASFGGLTFFRPENKPLADALGKDAQGRSAYRTWPDPGGVDPFTLEKDIVDHQVAILEFENGLRGTFHTNCNAGLPERRMLLLGMQGAIRADAVAGRAERRRIGFEEQTEVWDAGGSEVGHAGGDDVMAAELARTLCEGTPSAAGMPEAIESLVTCLAIDRAMDENRIVPVNEVRQERRLPGS